MMVWGKTGLDEEGVTVTVSDRTSLLADLSDRFARGVGFSVATLNLDHAVKLGRDPEFLRAYRAQTHVTADGNPVVWLSRLAGQRDVSLVPGSELIDPLAALAAEKSISVALYGSSEESLAASAEALEAAHPGLNIVWRKSPPMGFDPDGDEARDAIEAIGRSGARLVFLALGAPRQERFAARAQDQLPNIGFLSIGAGLDFVSGAQVRAPALVRALAAEWLWRMLGDPRRLARRYAACLGILPSLTVDALRARQMGTRLL